MKLLIKDFEFKENNIKIIGNDTTVEIENTRMKAEIKNLTTTNNEKYQEIDNMNSDNEDLTNSIIQKGQDIINLKDEIKNLTRTNNEKYQEIDTLKSDNEDLTNSIKMKSEQEV